MSWKNKWRELSAFRRFAAAALVTAGIVRLIATFAFSDDRELSQIAYALMGVSWLIFSASLFIDYRAKRRTEQHTL